MTKKSPHVFDLVLGTPEVYNGYQPPWAHIAQKINFSKYVHIIYDFVAFLILIIFYKKISENKPERTYLPRV